MSESDSAGTLLQTSGVRPGADSGPILLTGATGYVGGRLLRVMEEKGWSVRCMARDPARLASRVGPRTEIVAGDVLDPASLEAALAGVRTAYYLVHSMGAAGSFEEMDRKGAANFGRAAREAGVGRIIYLGGLGEGATRLSSHLKSRQEVGEILRSSGPQVIELRASIVIGSGSLSFEMIRALVERLPIMVTPRWVAVRAQPIAISDLLAYLVAAAEHPLDGSRIVAIGGAEQVSYGEIMKEYARQRRLRRLMIPIPLLTPHLSSLWLGLVTPLYARVGRKLVDSLRHPTIVQDESALRLFPIRPIGVAEAVRAALRNEDREFAETRWSDALSAAGPHQGWTGRRFGSRIVDSRVVALPIDAASAFRPIRRIGGRTGWYYGDRLWSVRGAFDLLVGGVGIRRGRRDPEHLRVGDAVDCWRVERIEEDRRLRLAAEMRLPGRAWLEFEVREEREGDRVRSTIWQTAVFDPIGLMGILYWYLLYPAHQLVFAGMLRGIAASALAASRASGIRISRVREVDDAHLRP